MRHALAALACLALSSLDPGRAAAEPEPEASAYWDVGIPIGRQEFHRNDGGYSLGLALAHTRGLLRAEGEVAHLVNPVEAGTTARLHGGVATAFGGRWDVVAVGGYRYLHLDNECRESCDTLSTHSVTARAGVGFHAGRFRVLAGGELGIAFSSEETMDDSVVTSGLEHPFTGVFVEVGLRLD